MRFLKRFGGLEEIAKLNSASIKSHGNGQLATQFLGTSRKIPVYSADVRTLWKENSCCQLEYEAHLGEQTVALYAPRRSHLKVRVHASRSQAAM